MDFHLRSYHGSGLNQTIPDRPSEEFYKHIKLSSLTNALRRKNTLRPLDSWARIFYLAVMAATATPEVMPGIDRDEKTDSSTDLEPGYLVICWNDPVNLMDYVTHVFQIVFGWKRQKAEVHMLQVHNQGKSVLKRESLEKAEFYVHQLQKYSLQATMEHD
jgi:ATP-dependent Clp protease adaptor protein ClpS